MTATNKKALYLVVLIIYSSLHLHVPCLPTNDASHTQFNGNGIMHHTLSKNIVDSNLLNTLLK